MPQNMLGVYFVDRQLEGIFIVFSGQKNHREHYRLFTNLVKDISVPGRCKLQHILNRIPDM